MSNKRFPIISLLKERARYLLPPYHKEGLQFLINTILPANSDIPFGGQDVGLKLLFPRQVVKLP